MNIVLGLKNSSIEGPEFSTMAEMRRSMMPGTRRVSASHIIEGTLLIRSATQKPLSFIDIGTIKLMMLPQIMQR
jgi:hypothetical protein